MTVTITLDDARRLMKEAVKEKGSDYCYQNPASSISCLYAHASGPGCIVGHVLYRAGVPLEVLADMDNLITGLIFSAIHDSGILNEWNIIVHEDAARYLRIAQQHQDNGYTWGLSLNAAEKTAKKWAKS